MIPSCLFAPLRSLMLLAIACEPNKGEDTGPSCRDDEQPIAAAEDTPLGFSAQAVIDLVTTPYAGTLTWADDDTTTPLSIAYTSLGEAWFVDSEVVPGTGDEQPAIEPICEDRIAVAVSISFATDDGAFAESWDERVEATAVTAVRWTHELDSDAIVGTFDLLRFVTSTDYDELRAWVDGVVTAPGVSSGQVAGQASGSEDCDPGDTCSSWAEEIAVGSWGKADTP